MLVLGRNSEDLLCNITLLEYLIKCNLLELVSPVREYLYYKSKVRGTFSCC